MEWTKNRILSELQALANDGVVSSVAAFKYKSSLPAMAYRLFGSFAAACSAAGLRTASEAKPRFKVCCVPECGLPVRSAGKPYCEKHYMRLRRRGTLNKKIPQKRHRRIDGYVLLYAPGHPLLQGKKRSRDYEHRIVFYDNKGIGPFNCYWCNSKVTWETMHVDHKNNEKTDNRFFNLVPSCPRCNQKRGLEKMRRTMREKHGRRIKFNGQTMCLSEWARKIGIGVNGLRERLKAGWSIQRAFTTPRGPTGPAPKENSFTT